LGAATEYGNERMGEIAGRTFDIPPELSNDLLNTRTVRSFLRDYAEDNPDSRELMDLLSIEPDPDQGFPPFSMTLRQVDSLRRAANAAGEARPEVRFRLTELADEVDNVARSRVPEYDEFLSNFSNLMARADGAEAGFRVGGAQPTRLAAEMDRLSGQNVNAGTGAQQAARRAVFDEATRGPRSARRLAERIVEDPRNLEATAGPSAGRIRRAAQAGVEEVEEATRALDELKLRQRSDREALDDLYMQRRNRQTREFDEQIDMIEDRMRDRTDAIRRAEEVVSGDTSQVVRGAQRARETGLEDDFRSVARTRLAETAEESGSQAASVAESLANDPGLQRRVNAVFGEDEAQRLFGRGQVEARGSEATRQAFQGVGTGLRRLAEDEQAMLLSAVDLGVLSTNRASGSFMGSAAVRIYRLVNGDRDRALSLVRALTQGDEATVQRTIQRLERLGASREFQNELAQMAASGAGIAAGQSTPPEDLRQ